VINVLLISQVVLVDPAVIVSVPSLVLAVIVLLVAGVVVGWVIVIVGAVVSLIITYVFELVGHHHVSLILMITFVVHSTGVNQNDSAFALSVHVLHPFIEYPTAVFGDGVAVSVILHVVAADELVADQFAYTVQLSVGAGGAVLSRLQVFEVILVVLQFHAASHTFGVTLHVDADHSVLIRQVTHVHDVIPILSV